MSEQKLERRSQSTDAKPGKEKKERKVTARFDATRPHSPLVKPTNIISINSIHLYHTTSTTSLQLAITTLASLSSLSSLSQFRTTSSVDSHTTVIIAAEATNRISSSEISCSSQSVLVSLACTSSLTTTTTTTTTTTRQGEDNQRRMAPNLQRFSRSPISSSFSNSDDDRIKCALLGTGMMGQEHISYIMGYSNQVRIDYLCDPYQPSLDKAQKIMNDFAIGDPVLTEKTRDHRPRVFTDEAELFEHVDDIDLLIIASPNYTHTPILQRWGRHDITILVEKPVAVSQQQHDDLLRASCSPEWKARIWVAMEYRYIPAIAKLLELVPMIGETKMLTIRENRYPFLHKIGKWNRDVEKTGDTLVEKCCHFFDLFRLISSKEPQLSKVRALAQRGINYNDEEDTYDCPIIDSAYVTMPFRDASPNNDGKWSNTIGCLELCMFSEGSRHQEEIIVTGTKGRLEAYLPENKVYLFERPNHELWNDRSVPPPSQSIRQQVFDCSDVRAVHSIDSDIPTHSGYHYCSTAVEWCYLLQTIQKHELTGQWTPHVSLDDGLRAVQMGIVATSQLVNELDDE